jgi:hypothetical protein
MTQFITEPLQELLLGIDNIIDTEPKICNDNILYAIKTFSHEKLSKMMSYITSQPHYIDTNSTYSMFKIDILTNNMSYCLDFAHDYESEITINSDHRYIYFTILSAKSTFDYICNNPKNFKYIFIPIRLYSNIDDIAHQAIIVFDVHNSKVYFADPNGKTTMFDNILYLYAKSNCDNDYNIYKCFDDMYINSEKLIEDLMKLYIEQINIFSNTKFKFVERNIWNTKASSLNHDYGSTMIGSGHCVILTILIANYLSNTQCDISKIYEIFENLQDEQIIQIINSYSTGIYELLMNIG